MMHYWLQMSRAPRPGSISIENVTGPKANSINGVYEPTSEQFGGLPVYQKKGNGGGMWLEFYLSDLKWSVHPTSCRGTNKRSAFAVTERPCLPQDCAGAWRVDMDTPGFEAAPLVVVTLLSALPNDLVVILDQAQLQYDTEV